MSDSIEKQVLEQLEQIYAPDNLAKDTFFREMTEQDPEGWVSMKKISNIKRFKTLVNGDLSLFQNAVQLAPEDFKINDQKTHLRCCKKVLTEEEKKEEETEKKQNAFESKLHTQNQRSIYCKGFPVEPEPNQKEVKEFFEKQGRVVTVRFRREGNTKEGTFKGSVFIEYESPEIAQVAVETIKEYPGITEPLLVMNKQEYIDMKSKEKFGNAAWDTEFSEVKNFIEYYNAEQLNFKEIKELVAAVTPIGRLEEVGGRGSGVIQLNEITPEEFLEKLVDNKIQDVCFRLASDDARREFIKIQKNFRQQRQQSKRGGRGGRGGRGRGGRGGRGNGRGGGFRGEKRANDNPSSEFDPKRPRPVRGSGIEVKASTPKKEN